MISDNSESSLAVIPACTLTYITFFSTEIYLILCMQYLYVIYIHYKMHKTYVHYVSTCTCVYSVFVLLLLTLTNECWHTYVLYIYYI